MSNLWTRGVPAALAAVAVATSPSIVAPPADTDPSPTALTLPVVSPTPQSLTHAGRDVAVTGRVLLVVDERTDAAARDRLVKHLKGHGVERVDIADPRHLPKASPGRLTVLLGPAERPDIAQVLGGTAVPDRTDGYAIKVSSQGKAASTVVALGGHDETGQFYAVQTLRQLFRHSGGKHWKIANVQVTDFPSMGLRGTIEGFYGQPWTHAERLDQMNFYGDIKANTYVYAPKDDPFHRSKWRDPYPTDKLNELGALVARASANHVRFTFAVSPGESICYSSPADRVALKAKLQALYDLGTRAFSVPLDDISYTKWNCDADLRTYGAPGRAAAAAAQVDLLNDLQRTFISTHPATQPLQMVPTEYGDLTDTAYKQKLRAALDPAVVVMWTGTDVVPPSITNAQADASSKLFGRKVFVWDNYPVNDYGNTSGRLLLAPYDKREAGLSDHISGIVANPMNQPYASKVAVFGAADFAWNDRAYQADTSWQHAMAYLAGGDTTAAKALQVFGDLEHLAPTFGAMPWQSQAPGLTQHFSNFWSAWTGSDRERLKAVRELRAYALRVERAPATIRDGAVQQGFLVDTAPWLDATALWGRALVKVNEALDARIRGLKAKSDRLAAEARSLQAQARAVRIAPSRNTWGEVQPKVGDGVLDTFLARADALLTDWETG
ncbi:beta-N-acetylglucosaminidase domain-containing protein [Streptomyces cacaoi]